MNGVILYQSKYGATKRYAEWLSEETGFQCIETKKAVFCCGASPYEENAFLQIKKHNIKDNLSDIPVFYCRGAWDMDAMSFKDRTLCNLLRKAVAKKDPSDYEIWEKALMEAGDNNCDWTDKKYIEPIMEYIKR